MITLSDPLAQQFHIHKGSALLGAPWFAMECSEETGSGALEIKCRIYCRACTLRDTFSQTGNKITPTLSIHFPVFSDLQLVARGRFAFVRCSFRRNTVF
jgi:hypothetical protein